MDHIVPAGHRLVLVVGGTDNWRFSIPSQTPDLTFNITIHSGRLTAVVSSPRVHGGEDTTARRSIQLSAASKASRWR
jgi:X-Pro dipeptidyl-peptidase